MEYKLVIVVRTDLGLSKGKMAAQVSHAAVNCALKSKKSDSSNFRKFSTNWWRRRNQAHEYFHFFCKNNDIKFKKNLDYLLTKFICLFISL